MIAWSIFGVAVLVVVYLCVGTIVAMMIGNNAHGGDAVLDDPLLFTTIAVFWPAFALFYGVLGVVTVLAWLVCGLATGVKWAAWHLFGWEQRG